MQRVLVVDDSALIRRGIAELLTREGFEVVAVASGELAVERAATEPFDLIVSDVRMGAMTGVQLCRVLRADPPTRDVPFVLLSGSDDPRSRFWGMHGGADAYLPKEGCFDTLVPAVRYLLGARPPRATSEARRPGRVDAAARVSNVMDQQLFEAVVAAETRKLMADVDDRERLMSAAARLMHDVFAASAVSLTLHERRGPTHAIVARGRDAPTNPEAARALLGLTPAAIVAFAGEADPRAQPISVGDPERFAIGPASAPLGELAVHRGSGAVGTDDRATAMLFAAAIEPVARCAMLVEETGWLARTDALTGLANRRTLVERLEYEDSRSARYGSPLSIIVIDVDHFKSINDRFGHNEGDAVLAGVARAIAGCVRNVDLAGRWGGEEFVVILPECDRESVAIVGERIRARIEETCVLPDESKHVTASLGTATRDATTPSAMGLIERADQAMYRAKQSGRNRVLAFVESVAEVSET